MPEAAANKGTGRVTSHRVLSLIGRVLPLQVPGRDTSEQIVVEIVYRSRDEPKLVEHIVDQPANGRSNGSLKFARRQRRRRG